MVTFLSSSSMGVKTENARPVASVVRLGSFGGRESFVGQHERNHTP
jgi:hypothetical protein